MCDWQRNGNNFFTLQPSATIPSFLLSPFFFPILLFTHYFSFLLFSSPFSIFSLLFPPIFFFFLPPSFTSYQVLACTSSLLSHNFRYFGQIRQRKQYNFPRLLLISKQCSSILTNIDQHSVLISAIYQCSASFLIDMPSKSLSTVDDIVAVTTRHQIH